jgi:hypothetical protein
MKSDTARELLTLIETQVARRPSPVEYEMAYQVRVAIDRIQFAIRHIEQVGPLPNQNRDASLQLLDALDRLTGAELKFQNHFRDRNAGDYPTEPRRKAEAS